MQLDLIMMEDFIIPTSGSVGCPNCDMVLAFMAYLEIHINRSATMCHLCGMQCCYGVNLKKHMNIKCDLAKRNRNYGVIAKESAILGRGIINSKKLYNLPLKQMWTNKRKMLANKITERKTPREIRVVSFLVVFVQTLLTPPER